MTSQPGKQRVATHVVHNIYKSNLQVIRQLKLSQLIEYKKRFFFETYAKCDRETFPRPISKKAKLSISLDQWLKVFTVWGHSKSTFVEGEGRH